MRQYLIEGLGGVLAGAVVLVGVVALLWRGSGDTDWAPQARPAPQARAPWWWMRWWKYQKHSCSRLLHKR